LRLKRPSSSGASSSPYVVRFNRPTTSNTGCKKRLASNDAHHRAPPPPPPQPSSSSSSSSSLPSILHSPLQWYIHKLDTHPLMTKGITSGLISGSGDLLCQYIISSKKEKEEEGEGGNKRHNTNTTATATTNHDTTNNDNDDEPQSFDWLRTARFTILGSFLVAPVVHVWYGHLMRSIPGGGVSSVAKRLFCDQGLFAPIFTATFISCLTVLEHVIPDENENDGDGGGGGDDTNAMSAVHNHHGDVYTHLTTRLRNDLPEALVVGWSMWVPSMAFMFAFVPGKFQVLFSNGVGFVWNAYLSWRTHEGEEGGGS